MADSLPAPSSGPPPPDLAWSVVRIGDSDSVSLERLRAAGGTAFILGQALVGATEDERYLPALWRSTDGSSWTETILDEGAATPAAFLVDVVHGDRGYLVIGCMDNVPCTRQVAWRSSDGETWRRAATDTGYQESNMLSVAIIGHRYIAAGAVCQSGATALTSGVRATLVRWPPPFTVVAARKGCAERTLMGRAMVWESTDGLEWTPTKVPPGVARLVRLIPDGDELLAIGFDDDGRSALWRRGAGGPEWQLESRLPEAFAIRQVTKTASGLIAVGTSTSENEPGDQVWRYRGGAWISQRIELAPGNGAALHAVVDIGSVAVVVGMAGAPDIADPQNEGSEAAVWVSSGDDAWARATNGPDFKDDAMVDAVVVGNHVIALGMGGAIWTHPFPP